MIVYALFTKRCVQWTCSSLRRGGRLLSSNQSGRSLVNDLRRHKPISTPRILITEFPWIYNSLQQTRQKTVHLHHQWARQKRPVYTDAAAVSSVRRNPCLIPTLNYSTETTLPANFHKDFGFCSSVPSGLCPFSQVWILGVTKKSLDFGFWIFTRWNQKDKTANHRCKRQNRGTFWPLPVWVWDGTTKPRLPTIHLNAKNRESRKE